MRRWSTSSSDRCYLEEVRNFSFCRKNPLSDFDIWATLNIQSHDMSDESDTESVSCLLEVGYIQLVIFFLYVNLSPLTTFGNT